MHKHFIVFVQFLTFFFGVGLTEPLETRLLIYFFFLLMLSSVTNYDVFSSFSFFLNNFALHCDKSQK